MDPDERELIEEILEFGPAVEGFFRSRGFPAEECRDLRQETSLQAIRSLPGFRRESTLKTWLFRIAENVSFKHLRRAKALKRAADEVSLDELESQGGPWPKGSKAAPAADLEAPLADLLGQEQKQVIIDAVQGLPPQMRRCLMLYTIQHRPYREIADVMQVSINTVKSHIHQGRRRLRDTLGDYFGLRP